MYAAAIDQTSLAQGDIVSHVQILGAINPNNVLLAAPTEGEARQWTVATAPRFADAMVLSHSCEVALENAVKVTSIILAPLRDISTATPAEKRQELIDSNVIGEGTESSYLKYFYVPPHDALEFDAGAVVDFSKCFSLRKQAYSHLLGRKALELTAQGRSAMALKLALYFHRNGANAA